MEFDRDLVSVQQARTLCAQAKSALEVLKSFSQREIDKVVASMAEAGYKAAMSLAEKAVEETGFGIVADKALKNQIATRNVHQYISQLKTVGIIHESKDKKVIEIADPVGVIAGIIPVTNPTSTTLFKAIIALKARNTIVFSPHPSAVNCIAETVKLMQSVVQRFGIPREAVGIITIPTLKATAELLQNPHVALILATGGARMVKSAYSSGKPAYGVGPGNVPAFIERTADVEKAVADIIASKTFDNGTVCASEQSIIIDSPIFEKVTETLRRNGAYFLNRQQTEMVSKVLITSELTTNPGLVGKPAATVAEQAGFLVPKDTTLLVAELERVGKEVPLSAEKLCPVIAMYKADGWEAGCDRCIQLLQFGGIGHTLAIHSNDQQIIMEFALKKPAYRILVNTPSTHGAIGFSTDLPPSMTLGCGTLGGNMTSDNITPLHLINIKRLAFETHPLPTAGRQRFQASAQKPRRLITERDVRQAISNGEIIELTDNIILTPLARELGMDKGIFR